MHKTNIHERAEIALMLINGVAVINPGQLEPQNELQHLPWPEDLPDLNIIKPLWTVLVRRVRSRFLPSTSLKQLEEVFIEDTLETIHKLHLFKEGQKILNKEILPISQVFTLFCPTPVCLQKSGLRSNTIHRKIIIQMIISSSETEWGPPEYMDNRLCAWGKEY